MRRVARLAATALGLALWALTALAADVYRNEEMDFGALQTVAVLPIANLTRDSQAADRVRDVVVTLLLATDAFYVLPIGEVGKALGKAAVVEPAAPTVEETVKLCQFLKADALVTGILREYGEARSGSATANVISLSLRITEGQTGRVVWSASATKGGVGWITRLFGGGGDPMNDVTEKAVDELISKLFK